MPMAETFTPTNPENASVHDYASDEPGPKQSTIAFIRQFARVYTAISDIRVPVGELIPN